MGRTQVDINQEKIKELRAEYNSAIANASKIKDMKLFDEAVRQANMILDKMNTLKKKNANMLSGKPPNGYSDWSDEYKFLE